MWEQVSQALNQSVTRVITRIATLLPGFVALVVAVFVAAVIAWAIGFVLKRFLRSIEFDSKVTNLDLPGIPVESRKSPTEIAVREWLLGRL